MQQWPWVFWRLYYFHVKFLSNGISGYSGFNLRCKMPYGHCIIVGNSISELWFSIKKKKKEKINYQHFKFWSWQFSPGSCAVDYPDKGGKHWRSICCLFHRSAQKTDLWSSCPWRLMACLITHLLKVFSEEHQFPTMSVETGGQFQMEICLTDFPEEVAQFFCCV